MGGTLFELELLGGGIERRYRRARPEVDAMPWGSLDVASMSPEALAAAQKGWTGAAFQEWRTGLACSATLAALFEASAPLDLIALASRFPLDELTHVEMCARLAMELGGATEIRFDPSELVHAPLDGAPPLLRAADLVVRFFCVGEALSIPLLRGAHKAARHALPRAVLARIVRDEAAHGVFGFHFLDWADASLGAPEKAALGLAADDAIEAVGEQWAALEAKWAARDPAAPPLSGDGLAWMQTGAYLAAARRAMERQVVAPLRARGIPIAAWPA